ncbi:Anaphase-promoting complex subunit 4 WD40 domain [Trinorchestia longiramus]|nr:Anaphase-promoting complex subunit 4 WD40 domain [Trinorchestia longiramus]
MSGVPACQVKQVAEQHLSAGVTKCLWSPKMDLLLTANTHGHVLLQRHRSLQRVWQLLPPAEYTSVTGLTWRPDSNLIAVGYQSGLVLLVSLESGTEVHSFEVGEGVTSLSWHQYSEPVAAAQKDIWSEYMTPLPASDKWFTESHSEGCTGEDPMNWQNSHVLSNQDCLTLLVVGTVRAKVLLYAFGFVHCATVDLAETVPRAGAVMDAQCSNDMNLLNVIVKRAAQEPRVCDDDADFAVEGVHVSCDIAVISEHHRELYLLSRKHAEIQSLKNYATDAINRLKEAWEGILLEMDTKLDAYSGAKEEGEVAADFIDLLVFGYASPEFYMFLSNKLSEKGLKKLRQTVELGYTNMHKLVVKQLEAVGQGLVFVISQMLGMARRMDRYRLLGVEESVVSNSMKEAGAFLLKTAELQQVIGASMKEFLAFLKWLSAVHLRINGSTVLQELAKTTQQETNHILDFLHDTLEQVVVDKDGKRRRMFRLEGVSQYLVDDKLKLPLDSISNPWLKFLQAHPELQSHPLVLPPRRNDSLIQNYNSLAQQLIRMADRSVEVISGHIRVSQGASLVDTTNLNGLIISQRCDANKKMNAVIVSKLSPYQFYFYEWSTELNDVYNSVCDASERVSLTVGCFFFTRNRCLDLQALSSPNVSVVSEENSVQPAARIIGAQFYSSDVLSVLTQDFSNVMRCLFIQIPVKVLSKYSFKNFPVPFNWKVSDFISPHPSLQATKTAERTSNDQPLNLSRSLHDTSASPQSFNRSPNSFISHATRVPSPSSAVHLSPIDLSEEIESSDVCRLDVSGGLFAVSGGRKVAAVVAAHRRTIVLYETEVDDDDDDDEDGEVEDEQRIQDEKKE